MLGREQEEESIKHSHHDSGPELVFLAVLGKMQRAPPMAKFLHNPRKEHTVCILDERNRAIVIAESPERVIAAIRITSARWRSYLPLKNTECRPCVRRVAIRIARFAFVGVVFVPRATAEWLARVDKVR